MTRVTLLTDFGTSDGYVAAMKGVLSALAPGAIVDDATHEIAPGDVRAGAWALHMYWRLYPPATVHVAVVDPGVGGERRALAATVGDRLFVAPDNGVLELVLRSGDPAEIISIESPDFARRPASATFHGRDVFAPAAAMLARGVPLDVLGPRIDDPVRLDWAEPHEEGDALVGEVVHVDRFGNLVTNLPAERVTAAEHVRIGGRDVGAIRRTYSDVARGSAIALIGSAGLLEVSVRDGSAADELGFGRGVEVVVERKG